jgi:2-C-methyl-D-erythritol 4-phosphate cytidylyltransferase
MVSNYIVIVAGGSGKRMDATVPKQFLSLNGKPILMHTCERFYQYDKTLSFIIVLPSEHIETWNALCNEYTFSIPHKTIAGGSERFYSVKNALDYIQTHQNNQDALVAIHDGVRPLVSTETIHKAFIAAGENGNAIPVITVIDSVRKVEAHGSSIVDRTQLRLIQTPQVFKLSLITKAYQQPFSKSFTDDASVLETMGETIVLTEGNAENIKITRPIDLVIAESLIKSADSINQNAQF